MNAHVFKPDMPPPVKTVGVLAWMRTNLFSSWLNTLLTLFALYLIWLIVPPLLQWALIDANWVGTTRADCTKEGACWVFIQQRFGQFMYGYYPGDLRWRVDLTVWLAIVGVAPLFISRFPRKAIYGLSFLVLYPIIAFFLLHGGVFGLATVATSQWGGLMLTLVIATVGIAGALPLGIVLALGRRSNMPAIRVVCVTFIEFWRGVPLITVLFFATYMLPLFVPGNFAVDGLLRALIGVAIFTGAYMAEVIRGGLAAVARGQAEAASALGLSWWKTTSLIVLPQALRHVIPNLVNSFISLFKDTSLVSIVALFDLLGSLRASFSDPNWSTPTTAFTGFAFAGMIYFVFCFGMSRYSLFVENRLNAHRRH